MVALFKKVSIASSFCWLCLLADGMAGLRELLSVWRTASLRAYWLCRRRFVELWNAGFVQQRFVDWCGVLACSTPGGVGGLEFTVSAGGCIPDIAFSNLFDLYIVFPLTRGSGFPLQSCDSSNSDLSEAQD